MLTLAKDYKCDPRPFEVRRSNGIISTGISTCFSNIVLLHDALGKAPPRPVSRPSWGMHVAGTVRGVSFRSVALPEAENLASGVSMKSECP